ncbi:protein kinase [Candidatus Chloroploca sp. M-50]|uniref:non-specific serine/threonine protein kinase n=1 Tax=Candidatus Chloroploca mongolica TaxID=2528176 RepID=A0ABS4DGM3_9CHLR|nr:protein kinase [Candidatus Chloroploca mongolica]MBP1468578.1 protein kinase [Candidatus Chloroploca mongolica]
MPENVVDTRVNGFQLIARLGRGGQATTYLALPAHHAPGRDLAWRVIVKLGLRTGRLTRHRAQRWRLGVLKLASSATATSLYAEHTILAAPQMRHPHLVCLYRQRFPEALGQRNLGLRGAGAQQRVALALAYEPGQSLAQVLVRRQVPRDPIWAIKVAQQLADALSHLHRQGILHHDLHPANVLVQHPSTNQPYVRLIDLGAAERLAAPRRYAVYGTPGYLAPERMGPDPAPASPLVDVYGLGKLLAALTAHTYPLPALQRLIAQATAADPVQRAKGIPHMASFQARLNEL